MGVLGLPRPVGTRIFNWHTAAGGFNSLITGQARSGPECGVRVRQGRRSGTPLGPDWHTVAGVGQILYIKRPLTVPGMLLFTPTAKDRARYARIMRRCRRCAVICGSRAGLIAVVTAHRLVIDIEA